MRMFLAICAAGAVVGYGVVYFALGMKPAPEAEPTPEPTPGVNTPGSPVPVGLVQVVEVTDIDPLLDPKPNQPVGEPFDSAEPGVPINLQHAATPIPPSGD